MNIVISRHLPIVLLSASVALNIWQFLRPDPPPGNEIAGKSVRSPILRNHPGPMPSVGKTPDIGSNEEEDDDPSVESRAVERRPEQQSEDELIFGGSGNLHHTPVHGEPSGKVSPQRLKALANMPASQAGRFRLHARLLLPGERTLDLGSSEFAAGQRIKLERLKEFPFPTSVALARADVPPQPGQSDFPVIPTTPGSFEFKNMGLEIDLDVTPAPGLLVIGGSLRQTVFEGFGRMPGEAFSPIYTTGASESGSPVDVILTDNKVLQPQFITRECPFVAAATAGHPMQVPVLMSFGQTWLELTCTPIE